MPEAPLRIIFFASLESGPLGFNFDKKPENFEFVFEFKMFRAEFHQKWTKKPPQHTQTFARSRVSHLVDQKHLKI